MAKTSQPTLRIVWKISSNTVESKKPFWSIFSFFKRENGPRMALSSVFSLMKVFLLFDARDVVQLDECAYLERFRIPFCVSVFYSSFF